jgi:hypothetical protein
VKGKKEKGPKSFHDAMVNLMSYKYPSLFGKKDIVIL